MNNNYLKYLQEKIHSTVIATIDENGLPITCVIDIMYYDKNSLYFLTAKGKAFYKRLKHHPIISLTGFKGEDTMSSKSITLQGEVREIDTSLLPLIFKKNPYMTEIYASEKSREALTVFQIYSGNGEFFDLSVKPIFRESFSFGNIENKKSGYFINYNCNACGECVTGCPQNCIVFSAEKLTIVELENAGYITRYQGRDDKGKMAGNEYSIY